MFEHPLNENPVQDKGEPECPYCFKVYSICACLTCSCCGDIVDTNKEDFCEACDCCHECCRRFKCPKD